MTKVIDTLTQEDFHGALQKLLERYNKCIAAGGNYFKGDKCFMCVPSIKVPIRKKYGNLFNDPRIYIYIYILNHHDVVLLARISLTPSPSLSLSLFLAMRLYHPLLLAGLLDYILCPYGAIENNFLLVCKNLHVRVKGSRG